MGNLLKQAQKMQKAMDEARAELKDILVEGTAGGGIVRATVRGDGQVERVEIEDDAWAHDHATLQELLVAALRDRTGCDVVIIYP